MAKPNWTVLYNIVSPESDQWIGTGREFFNLERDASKAYTRHINLGNTPTKRPFHPSDIEYLGACHRTYMEYLRFR